MGTQTLQHAELPNRQLGPRLEVMGSGEQRWDQTRGGAGAGQHERGREPERVGRPPAQEWPDQQRETERPADHGHRPAAPFARHAPGDVGLA